MFKPQMKFQKILFMSLLMFSAVVFIYSLGLMTDLYGLYQVKSIGSVKGSELFYDMQPYNKYLVDLAIVCILSSVVPYIVGSNSRRKYYIGNVIGTVIQACTYVITSVFILVNTIKYRSQFVNGVDFVAYKELADKMKFSYSESTFFFDAGFVIAALLLVAAGLVVYNLIWKTKIVKQENKILEGDYDGSK